ncbi:G-alpha-domain-containing protein [Ramaria rubella]|nr:G-alpha-domain-containing protein [Ramaria rubella]
MLAARRLSDPLAAALQPPPDESPKTRDARLADERAAQKVSDAIDEELRQEREERKARLRSRQEVKVLLLGQSESGKTTTLKQFQIAYTPNAFREERLAWRYVIYLNLVRSVRRIFDTLFTPEPHNTGIGNGSTDSASDDSPSPDSPRPSNDLTGQHSTELDSTTIHPPTPTPKSTHSSPPYTDLRARLEPVLLLEGQLIRQLAGGDHDEATHLRGFSTTNLGSPTSDPGIGRNEYAFTGNLKSTEVSVNNRHNWKRTFTRFARGSKSNATAEEWQTDPMDPAHILTRCSADIEHLWADEAVQTELKRKRIRLEETSGFYLDSVPRITSLGYEPSDDDVLKARLKTLGVVEHTFAVETGKERGFDWKIYDVGGARNQRQAWAPYFEDMNAIIFLAPISAFDQLLAEDSRVNRLNDSLILWRSLISNKLLSKVNIVLFLNKCDLLKKKLQAGVQLSHYMKSYGQRPNTYESVSKYLRSKFLALNQSYSSNPQRDVYLHLTSVTNTLSTASIINDVREIILRQDLHSTRML